MIIVRTTTETVRFQEENGGLIAEFSLTKHPLLINGYVANLLIGQAIDEPLEIDVPLCVSPPSAKAVAA